MTEFIALIVEDDKAQRLMLEHALKPISDNIMFAQTLADALRIIQATPVIHIITLDLSLPGTRIQDVLDSIATMRTAHPKAAIIILSGYAVIEHDADAAVGKWNMEHTDEFLRPLLAALTKYADGDEARIAHLAKLQSALLLA